MRTIERTAAFRRDYKRIKTNPVHKDIEEILPQIVGLLAEDKTLPEKYRDHSLAGTVEGTL